jgi:hypothetical protein
MGDKKPESEMDKTNPGEKPEAETAVVETTDQSTSTPDTEQVTLTKAEYTKMQKALKDANAEAAKRRKELDDKEKVGLTETERLKKELEDERKERLILMQESVAAKHGLPEALASRL